MLTRTVYLALILVLQLLPASLLFPAGTNAQQPPTITVAPSSAAPGETVTLTGSGWPPGAAIVARLVETEAADVPSAVVATATADGNGNFTVQGHVPPTLFEPAGARGNLTVVPGAYTIIASSSPDGSASTSFTVGAPQQGALLWGRVFRDVNGDGVFDPGDGLTFAQLAIENVSQPRPILRPFTDGRGFYLASSVSPGSYRLSTQVEFQSAAWVGSATAEAIEGQATRVDIPLRPGAPIITPTPATPSVLPETGDTPLPIVSMALVGAAVLVVGISLRLSFRC